METAKVFTNGGSQAVRLPKDCRFDEDEVLVRRVGNVVILVPKDDPWRGMMDSLPCSQMTFLPKGSRLCRFRKGTSYDLHARHEYHHLCHQPPSGLRPS